MENLVVLPNNGHAPTNESIAAHLREQADWIEAGDFSEVRNVYIAIEGTDGSLVLNSCGLPCDRARVLGIYMAAIIKTAVEE